MILRKTIALFVRTCRKDSSRMQRGLPLVIALLLLVLPGGGQDLGKLKNKLAGIAGDVTLRQLLVGKPLTTSLDDAVFDVPFLDPYNPPDCQVITELPRGPKGGWVLHPGSFMYLAQSYCMGPGARRPWQGDGYAYAPIKGPQADTIRSILRNSVRFPDIPQEQIQLLLWRIVARARWTNLPAGQKAIAARLLTPKQIAQLNGSALDLIPGDVLDRSLAEAVPSVARTLMAEAKMRELFASGEASYEELEEIAVPAGEPEPDEAQGRITPVRWSFHPGGYFIRYRPITYAETITQFCVPEEVKIETDSSGRILSLSDPVRRRLLRIAYNDMVPGDPYPDAAGVRAYLFKSVHFERPDPENPGAMFQHDFSDPAGTLMGMPPAGKSGESPLRWRYEFAREVAISTQRTLNALPVRRKGGRDAESLVNIVHLALGLDRLLARTADPPPWTFSLISFVIEAWQYALCRTAGVAAVAAPPGPSIGSRAGLTQSGIAGVLGQAGLFRFPAESEESSSAGPWPDAPGGDDTLLSAGSAGQQTTFVTEDGEVIELDPEFAVPGMYECQLIADQVQCVPGPEYKDPRSWMKQIGDWLDRKLTREEPGFKDRGPWFAGQTAANVPMYYWTSEQQKQYQKDNDYWAKMGSIFR
jgi:hypothetical protein